MYTEKDAYQYAMHAELNNPKGWKIRTIPDYSLLSLYAPKQTYTPSENVAYSFMEGAKMQPSGTGIDDMFRTKIVLSEDRINLLLGQLKECERLKNDNLKRIYDDLLRVDQFRAQINFPQSYMRDKAWSGLNDSELKLREQLRRELSQASHDMGFLSSTLRDSLLEFKLQNVKESQLSSIDIGGTLDEIIEPGGSYKPNPGDLHEIQDHQQYDQYP